MQNGVTQLNNYDLNDTIRTFIKSHPIPNPINVTLTEKQHVNQFWIDDTRSSQNFRYFRNILNRNVFGNAAERFGRHLKIVVIREEDMVTRHHIHCVIETPKDWDTPTFTKTIERAWHNTEFGYASVHTKRPESEQETVGWLAYILKHKTKKVFADAIDWDNCQF